MIIPEECARYSFCFKRTLIGNDQGNNWKKVPDITKDLINRSIEKLEYPFVLP